MWRGRAVCGLTHGAAFDETPNAVRIPVVDQPAGLELRAREDAVEVAARSFVGAGARRLARGRVGVDGHHRRSALRNSWASENYKMRGLRKLLKIEVRVLARTAVKSLL